MVWSRSEWQARAPQPGAGQVAVRARTRSLSLRLGAYRCSAAAWSQDPLAIGVKVMFRSRRKPARAAGPSRLLPPPGGGAHRWGPRAVPWAAAVPSGASRVTAHRVAGWAEAAWVRRRVSAESSRPQPAASPGARDQPNRVPAGMVRLISAGNGAGLPDRLAGPGSSPGPDR